MLQLLKYFPLLTIIEPIFISRICFGNDFNKEEILVWPLSSIMYVQNDLKNLHFQKRNHYDLNLVNLVKHNI